LGAFDETITVCTKESLQNMSRKRNCLNIAVIQNFFGVLKAEIY
jgi:hypothetical protein